MAHHAYYAIGEQEQAIRRAAAFMAARDRSEGTRTELVRLSFNVFSVDDARRLVQLATTSGVDGRKAIIASMTRVFHEAQNALLKVLEEPPQGTTIILCVPTEGMLLQTVRSRVLPLPDVQPGNADEHADTGIGTRFSRASRAERERMIAQLLERSKSDKDEVKQEARSEAIELVSGLMRELHREHSDYPPSGQLGRMTFLEDLSLFMPILYERSAPLKQIFEHVLLCAPEARPAPSV